MWFSLILKEQCKEIFSWFLSYLDPSYYTYVFYCIFENGFVFVETFTRNNIDIDIDHCYMTLGYDQESGSKLDKQMIKLLWTQ